ncbi:DMT family transporter [Paracoccus sp. (in: a-proteobacteria)]|uniref:DMT family transporter n=1 Tax=Paracoccus sp. TaxID=267 RepID=UPI0026DFE7C6|nr:DMT family transporter [Paracoccus sp. (in: a-proteobacteria)]MDO5370878.1 DMT family transporter [Paracoccus sp. (in: a-proteobacteria)]
MDMPLSSRLGSAWNRRGALFMCLAMAGFSVEDALLKLAAGSLPVGQVLMTFGVFGVIAFSAWAMGSGEPPVSRAMLRPAMILRSLSEVVGRLFFMLAIALTPLSTASAILQATPLVVMVGAVVIFGERIGPRRWLAVAVGLAGVLMILRPGAQGFGPLSVLAVLATLGFAGRDLATRAAPPALSFRQLGVLGFIMLIVAGLISLPFGPAPVRPDAATWFGLVAASVAGIGAYTSLTIAMRTGEVGAVTPFRYTRLVFAMIAGIMVFGERPDLSTVTGSVLIILAGITALRLNRRGKGAA